MDQSPHTDATACPDGSDRPIAAPQDLLDALECGVSVFDADLVLVACNRRYREILDLPDRLCRPGVTLRETLRFNAERGEYGPGDPEALATMRMTRVRRREPHRLERVRPDGRTIEIIGRPLADGGLVTTYLDHGGDRVRTQAQDLTFDTLLRALDYSSDAFHIWDAEDRLVYANAEAHRLNEIVGGRLEIGMTFESLIRQQVERLGLPAGFDDVEAFWNWRVGVHRSGDRSVILDSPSGVSFMLRETILPDGMRLVTMSDVTDLKRAEREAVESEQRFRDFVEASSDRFWQTDPQHRFTKMVETSRPSQAPRAEALLGRTRWEHVGADPETDPHWQRHRQTLDRHEPFRDFRYDIPMPTGEIRHWRVSGVPAFDARGRFLGYRGSATDETETRREAEEARRELERALDEAEIANRAKSLFLAMVSHELRTPLNAIIGFADLMLSNIHRTTLDPRHEDYLRNVRISGQHLHALIEDVLNMARLEVGELTPRETWIDLGGIVDWAAETAADRQETARQRISVTAPDPRPALWADGRMIRQALLNLIGNALKFSAPDGAVEIEIGFDVDGARVVIRDHGPGIPEERVETLLRPFEQADAKLSRIHEGLGLGLPLAQAFVRLHGGNLDIASEPGIGTTVQIRFGPERLRSDFA